MKIQEKNKIFVGNNIRELKKYQNITTEKLAKNIKINVETFKNYEGNQNEPSYKTLISLSNFFNISADFLLLWDNCNYIKNTKLFLLAEKIDKMEQTERYQIESTSKSLLGTKKSLNVNIKFDSFSFELTQDIHDNLKILSENNKELTQRQIADFLNIETSMVSSYKTRTKPSAEKLIKLSEIFKISIHSLTTGEKLNYHFKNEGLKEAILKADKFLSLEDHKILIRLMEAILQNQSASS